MSRKKKRTKVKHFQQFRDEKTNYFVVQEQKINLLKFKNKKRTFSKVQRSKQYFIQKKILTDINYKQIKFLQIDPTESQSYQTVKKKYILHRMED